MRLTSKRASAARPPWTRLSRSLPSSITATIASASLTASSVGTINPLTPDCTVSRLPAASLTITGTPARIASSGVYGAPSKREASA
jgi:hypothetical protein